jgi:hypothetical protein
MTLLISRPGFFSFAPLVTCGILFLLMQERTLVGSQQDMLTLQTMIACFSHPTNYCSDYGRRFFPGTSKAVSPDTESSCYLSDSDLSEGLSDWSTDGHVSTHVAAAAASSSTTISSNPSVNKIASY